MATSRVLHRHTLTALSTAGLGGLFAMSLSQAQLAQGGIAVVCVAAVAAALVGVPVAMASRKAVPDPDHPGGAALNGLTEVWTAIAVAAAAGPVVAALGPLGWILGGLAWVLLGFGPGVRRAGAIVLVIATLLGLSSLGTLTLVDGPPWTLLEVQWLPWTPWVSAGIVGGLVVSGAGLAVGPDVPATSNLRPRGIMALAGFGLLAAVVAALRVATPYEQGVGILEAAPLIADPLWTALAVVLVTSAVVGMGVDRGRRSGAGLVGLLAPLAFAGPAADALPRWWSGLLPAGLAASLLLRAALPSKATLVDRATLGLGAVVALAVPVLASPELPGPLAAGLLGLAPVAVVWAAGTRALLSWRAA